MPNIATALKAEISRVARKEVRAETDALRVAVGKYRRDLAALKQRVQELERQSKRVARAVPPTAREGNPEDEGRPLRFSASRFAAQRTKLGLSAADFAKLLGVSALSVYKWEGGKTRPRRAQLEAIAATRGLGKREALARLEQLSASR